MWFGHEIWGNSANQHEAKVLANKRKDEFGGGDKFETKYTVKVGDICFVAIGQITNRPYNAVCCHPTACIVINSTVRDETLASEVRDIWGESDYQQKLLDSLLTDFCTQWQYRRDYLQTGAAIRLAYYFPEEAGDLIASRFRSLGVTSADWERQMKTNGYFIQGAAWSVDPRIRAELLGIFKKTKEPEILLAALPGIDEQHDVLALHRLTEAVRRLSKEEDGPYGDGYNLLVAIGERFPQQAHPIFEGYLETGSVQRRWTMCLVLREITGELSVELLTPLLSDRRTYRWTYAVEPGKDEPQLPLRVCDVAAETIAGNSNGRLTFVLKGTHKELDRQIEAMQRDIEKMKASRPAA